MEAALCARPKVQLPIGIPERGRVVGFNIALVYGGSGVFLLHHQISLGKSFRKVSSLVAHVGGNVAGVVSRLTHIVSPEIFVEQRRVVLHGHTNINNGF